MPLDAGFRGSSGYAPGFSAADFDPRALVDRLRHLEAQRARAHRDLARAEARKRRLGRLIAHCYGIGLLTAAARAEALRAVNGVRLDEAAGRCDDLSDEIALLRRDIEEQERLYQEAEERERLSLIRCTRMSQIGGLR